MKLRGLIIAILALSATWAKDWPEMRAEADRGLPPWIQYYNRLKGEPKLGPFDQHLSEPESLNVRLVGKWGRGPAARVTGRDTLVYLALGSEVAVFNCVNAHNPRIVNEIQCRYVVDRPILKDSILYCVLQGGVEVFNIANPASVTRIKYLPISAVDMCINDTMAYTIDADSFKAYRIVAPDSLQRLGACADSGYCIAADAGFAYLCDRWGLYVIDATDPANPHQATILTGAQTGAVWVDSGYCYYTTASASPNSFRIADVSDPYHPAEVGYIDGIASYDLFKLSYFVYLPGYYIVDVSTPSFPTTVGSTTYGGNGVWTRSPFSYSFIAADYNGLATINITDPVHPALDTTVAAADWSYGVCADGNWTYVANYYAGMRVLNGINPSSPREVGAYDTAGMAPKAHCVVALDSFAYLGTDALGPTGFRVIDVSHKDNPVPVGALYSPNFAGGLVLRDSLVYYAINLHLYVISIANPRNPRLVGSCPLVNSPWDLCLVDTLAYVTCLPTQIVNIKDPAHPVVVGSINNGDAYGICIQDTIALVGGSTKLDAVSVANPAAPYVISSFPLPGEICYGVAIDGTLAYIGTAATPSTSKLRVIDFSDPSAMRCIGYHLAPAAVLRVFRQDSLIYAACYNGGVCIFETTSTSSVSEAGPVAPRAQAFELTPNPASSFVDIRLEVKQSTNTRNTVKFFNAVGRVVLDVPYVADRGQQPRSQRVDISTLPEGCYFVAVEPSGQGRVQKVVKTGRRR
jgi:hypothetical protein